MLVPFIIPATRVNSSPLKLSIKGLRTGIPAATAASKYRQTLFFWAIAISSSPQSAIISLFAVITDLPFSSRDFIYSFPGLRPPKTSITIWIDSSLSISSKLFVDNEISKSLFFDSLF